MSRDEIKFEINKILEQFSEDALQDLLVFVKELGRKTSVYDVNSEALGNIIKEDDELLKRLAQ